MKTKNSSAAPLAASRLNRDTANLSVAIRLIQLNFDRLASSDSDEGIRKRGRWLADLRDGFSRLNAVWSKDLAALPINPPQQSPRDWLLGCVLDEQETVVEATILADPRHDATRDLDAAKLTAIAARWEERNKLLSALLSEGTPAGGNSSKSGNKIKHAARSKIERDTTLLSEFERGKYSTVAAFAQAKKMQRPAMSQALKRARNYLASQQSSKCKSSQRV